MSRPVLHDTTSASPDELRQHIRDWRAWAKDREDHIAFLESKVARLEQAAQQQQQKTATANPLGDVMDSFFGGQPGGRR